MAESAFRPPTTALTLTADSSAAAAGSSPASYPLHTSGRWIENAQDQRVKLASVNWGGTESAQAVVGGLDHKTMDQIASWIAAAGFNSVRIPWSNYMYEQDPVVSKLSACESASYDCLAANPDLKGLGALAILDQVIATLGNHGLAVILDDHNSDPEWCCSTTDNNGLWYNPRYSETSWVSDWQGMATRYLGNTTVIGAELRNEPREADGVQPVWGGGGKNDWQLWATNGGNGESTWSGWYTQGIGGQVTDAVAAMQYGQQVLLFARGTSSQVYEDAWSPSTTSPPGSWSGWYSIGGSVTDGLGATEFNDQVQVFGRGPDGQVYADVWTPSSASPPGSWSGWYTSGIGGQIVGAPAAVAFGQQLLLFARGTDNQVYEDRWQSPGPWSGWYTTGINGNVTSSPTAVAFGQYQVQIFARGTDGAVWDDVWTASPKSPPGSWGGWNSIGGSVTDALGATAFGPGQMQVFGRGTDGQVYADVWSDGGYQGFAADIGSRWGYILTQGQSYTAPSWVSEWGTCIQPASGQCDSNDTTFFSDIVQYLKAGDIDFAYWQLGSEILPGRTVAVGYDYYALLDPNWDDWPASTAASSNVATVESLEAPTQGP